MVDLRATGLDGVFEIIPRKFEDERGFFSETYKKSDLLAAGLDIDFVQDNHSLSRNAGVIRGLHYQAPPHAQAKLVRVVRGSIFDVAVDIRRESQTFAKWVGLTLSAQDWNQLLIPAGFAHGFLTLEPNTEVAYKTSDFYAPDHDRAIRFDDPEIAIAWPWTSGAFELSAKDRSAPLLQDAAVYFDA